MGDFKADISVFSGEPVILKKVKCKCGHVIAFISNGKCICRHCGRMVYASKKKEFEEKLLKEINRK